MFKKILIAADGSDHSIRAAAKAIQLAEQNPDSEITVVYAVDGQTSKEDILHHFDKSIVDQVRKKRLEPIENLLKEKGISYEIKILQGEPGPAIVEFANKMNLDVAVVGSRGLNTLQEMVLGSVSHKIAKRVKAPVLIVK
ncbi:nucleotide-binding universal stress UspA family protein [Cytobacillus firmus]|uniref:Nucleotide-binding universal stress UspA family protein n=2 Tax=Cytobacillus TaxID=2675230 RepID=A0A366JMA9_CYTFI|nr:MULTISPECIES: universal stress protein [Cytobacillus]RBP87997.1 nucleotide-binding universal stress UspA family protein [Cytobacillus firmus]TDX37729.1 nucleotide-binding universal stress UspA family protein [Cytobacillus oceanisediminis]